MSEALAEVGEEAINNKRRIFTDFGHYFSLFEDGASRIYYNHQTNEIISQEFIEHSLTHIIVTKCAVSGEIVFQIIRFDCDKDGKNTRLKQNPYAGVSLTKDECKKVFERTISL